MQCAAAYVDWPKLRLYRLTASGQIQIPHHNGSGDTDGEVGLTS